MGSLDPIAFDIETSGLDDSAVLTVAGLAHSLGEVLILNTDGRTANSGKLENALQPDSIGNVEVLLADDEEALLGILHRIAHDRLDDDKHYLTAYNGEVWNGGFDLPFVRTACIKHSIDWPFPEIAYADVFSFIDRFDTNNEKGLVEVYDGLIGKESCDPFIDSGAAVEAFKTEDWESLLLHNLSDIQRTRELAILGGKYVPRSDFQMKNLNPPNK
ncbi:hypothetical protein EGH24_06300 [Halonotius terrestris]|uniref:Uncharacterized protein n=1 Tax=Halonotius terrestris TaxID=2487750 RepID=A0A8J8PA48_9EURY|nr:hypothetical protein [Halonotius terrestris]TQQ83039.1 hypothetical protein EGH24_06300 [Halonotius terrestris]